VSPAAQATSRPHPGSSSENRPSESDQLRSAKTKNQLGWINMSIPAKRPIRMPPN